MTKRSGINRRDFLRVSALGAGAVGLGAVASRLPSQEGGEMKGQVYGPSGMEQAETALAGISVERQAPDVMDPMTFLSHFDYGTVSRRPDGQRLREFSITSVNRDIEVARGIKYPAWTFNRTVPGPTLRATEGDLVRVHFTNQGDHPHSIHFHGRHSGPNDGVFEQIPRGESYTYEFTAEPFGLYPYHCHTIPVRKHIEKGLYGTFVIDPPTPRPAARELVMLMNGFDVDFDEENEFYTINGIANYYLEHPIRTRVGELIRVYLVNMTEFDVVNSFHLHGDLFQVYRTGTSLEPDELTDTVMLCQGERHILEFRHTYPGRFIFHAHQVEFAELGWMGLFDVEG